MMHYHYIDARDSPHRIVIELDPSKMSGMPYGAIEWVYNPESTEADFVSNRLEEIQPFVRNGILTIQEVLDVGTVVTIGLRSGHVLEDIVLDDPRSMVELVNNTGMLYWILVGKTGVFNVRATVVEDRKGSGSKIAKLRANLKDIPLRQLLAEKAKVKLPQDPVREEDYPPYMDAEWAARYLDISIRTFYDIPREELPQAPHGRYRKKDLDKYMEDNLLHKKRPRKNAQFVPKKNVNDADSEESNGK